MADPAAPPVDPAAAAAAAAAPAPAAPAPAGDPAPVVADAPAAAATPEAAPAAPVAESAAVTEGRPPSLAAAAVAEPAAEVTAEKGTPEAAPPAPDAAGEPPPAPEVKSEAPVIEEKPAENVAEAPAAEAPAPFEYKYELAEDMALSDERRAELHQIFDGIRSDPANMQPLMDLHHKVLQETVQALRDQAYQSQLDVWSKTTEGWRNEVMADEMIGGAGHQTAMTRVALARDTFMSDHPRDSDEWRADQLAMQHFLDSTGAGDHPVFNRMMYRIGRFLKEPTTASIPQDTRPAPQQPNGGRRGAVLHDNPRSQQVNGRG